MILREVWARLKNRFSPKRPKSRRVTHRESILIEIDQDIVKRPEFKAYGVKDE